MVLISAVTSLLATRRYYGARAAPRQRTKGRSRCNLTAIDSLKQNITAQIYSTRTIFNIVAAVLFWLQLAFLVSADVPIRHRTDPRLAAVTAGLNVFSGDIYVGYDLRDSPDSARFWMFY